MNPTGPVLIVAAVPDELAWLAEHIPTPLKKQIGPYPFFSGRMGKRAVNLLVTGAGCVSMAAALGTVLPAVVPVGVILTGCGGGFSDAGLQPGDLAIATEEIAPQLGAEPPEGDDSVEPLSFLPNCFSLDRKLAEKAASLIAGGLPANCHIHAGPFITVSTVTATRATARRYRKQHACILENMEGFAAAIVCRLYAVPLLELRAVSNETGDRNKDNWQLPLSFERSQQAVFRLLEKDFPA